MGIAILVHACLHRVRVVPSMGLQVRQQSVPAAAQHTPKPLIVHALRGEQLGLSRWSFHWASDGVVSDDLWVGGTDPGRRAGAATLGRTWRICEEQS